MSEIEENGVKIFLSDDHVHPKSSVPYFNPKMKLNRSFVLLTLECLADIRDGILDCYDAFGATGMMGLQWKQHLTNRVRVLVSDVQPAACDAITRNAELNSLMVRQVSLSDLNDELRDSSSPSVTPQGIDVVNADCCLVLHKKSFDFIHLDPFGTSVYFLDAAFRNLRHGGILTLTSTDVASLLARNPAVVRRNYAASVIKTTYIKETAARIVVATAVRSAARCNKGVNLLYCLSSENFLLIALQVVRGTQNADKCLSSLSEVLHCRLCGDRVFWPSGQLAPVEEPYRLLPCNCKATNPGKTAVLLGPMWKEDLFNVDFVQRMHHIYKEKVGKVFASGSLDTLLELILGEAMCGVVTENGAGDTGRDSEGTGCLRRAPQLVITSRCPPFYFTPSRLKLSNVNLPRILNLLTLIREAGFLCCRTHFDLTALRTNMTCEQLTNLIVNKAHKLS